MIKTEKLAPLLAQDEEVLKLANEINTMKELYDQKVLTIQTACPHSNLIKKWEYPQKIFESEKGAMLQTECVACGLIQTKPDGMPWTICEKCWAPMRNDGEGREGGVRAHYYKCTKCHHKEYTT